MSKVYIIQGTRYQADVTPALRYGEIEFLLSPGDLTSCSPEIVKSKLTRLLAKFEPEKDYLVWAGGDPLSLMLVGSILKGRGIAEFRYLRYERPGRRELSSTAFYVPVTVRL